MVADFPDEHPAMAALGPRLLRSWLGYRRRVEERLAEAGFDPQSLPNGMVLSLCMGEEGMTVSGIGRELGISRQGASKQVTELCERGFLELAKSPGDGREKIARATPSAIAFLTAFQQARQQVDAEIRAHLGEEGMEVLSTLFNLLAVPAGSETGELWREARARVRLHGLGDQ